MPLWLPYGLTTTQSTKLNTVNILNVLYFYYSSINLFFYPLERSDKSHDVSQSEEQSLQTTVTIML